MKSNTNNPSINDIYEYWRTEYSLTNDSSPNIDSPEVGLVNTLKYFISFW